MLRGALLSLLFASAFGLNLRSVFPFKLKPTQASWPSSLSQASHQHQNVGNHNNNINRQGQLFPQYKGGRAQSSALHATATAYDYVAFTLDKSVLPRGGTNFGVLYLMLGFLLGSTFFRLRAKLAGEGVSLSVPSINVGNMIPRIAPTWSSRIADLLELALDTVSDIFDVIKAPFMQLLSFVGICCRVMWAKIALVMSSAFRTINNYIAFDPPDVLNIKDWRVCTIEEREIMSGNIVKYRLQLNNDNGIVPLAVGQELQLCSVDAKDRVVKESFFPITKVDERGYFDILIRRQENAPPFVKNLETMAIGEQLAFKAGRQRLVYQGQSEAITGISVAASHMGITPALQIMRGILSTKESNLSDAELLWLNEDESEFTCEREIESLEYRHIEKLLVTRIVEEDLYSRDVIRSEAVTESISPYDEGRLAIICAPDYIVSSLRSLFQELGYPSENILSIPVE